VAMNFKEQSLHIFKPGDFIMPNLVDVHARSGDDLWAAGLIVMNKIKYMILRKYGLV
jgi:hypothetical protein